jgi:colanic acid/amylovoran biosynthesis protein
MDHDDRQVTRRLFQRLQSAIPDLTLVDSFHCAADAHAAYAQMDLMIGTRMHTAILSLISGVPVILIGYQPKSCGGMQLIGLPQFCCPIDTVTADRLFALAEKILDDLTEHQQLYAARALEAQRALASWTDILWESL